MACNAPFARITVWTVASSLTRHQAPFRFLHCPLWRRLLLRLRYGMSEDWNSSEYRNFSFCLRENTEKTIAVCPEYNKKYVSTLWAVLCIVNNKAGGSCRMFTAVLNRRILSLAVGRDSSVGIATSYGLDGPGIESRWGRDFQHPSRPTLGPTQPSIQWVPGLFRR